MIRATGSRRLVAIALAAMAAGVVAVVAVALGLANGGYVIHPASTTGGGGTSSGGGYVLQGAIGQPFARSVAGSGYVVSNGVFPGSSVLDVPTFRLFTPNVVSNP